MTGDEPAVRVPDDFARDFPDASALATECFMNFGVVQAAAGDAFNALLDEHGVPSSAALNVLAIVDGASEPLSQREIAERMMVAKPTVSGVLDSLESRGLAERRPCSADARVKEIHLTAKGRQVVRAVLPEVHRFELEVMTALAPAEQRQLLGLLARLQHRLAIITTAGR